MKRISKAKRRHLIECAKGMERRTVLDEVDWNRLRLEVRAIHAGFAAACAHAAQEVARTLAALKMRGSV